jgi:hypothetical protein
MSSSDLRSIRNQGPQRESSALIRMPAWLRMRACRPMPTSWTTSRSTSRQCCSSTIGAPSTPALVLHRSSVVESPDCVPPYSRCSSKAGASASSAETPPSTQEQHFRRSPRVQFGKALNLAARPLVGSVAARFAPSFHARGRSGLAGKRFCCHAVVTRGPAGVRTIARSACLPISLSHASA